MADAFETFAAGLDSPARNAFAVTPADSDLAQNTRGIYVGGAGTVVVTMVGSGTAISFTVPAGTILPLCVKRIAAASTATLIVGLY
jgi:hypothetical protein